jgi:hypothetical protein
VPASLAARRFLFAARTWVVVQLDRFLGWPPFVQIPVIILLTAALIVFWGISFAAVTGGPVSESSWHALTRFVDGGAMSHDTGAARLVAVCVTATGILVISFLTGAFASKLSERLQELRSGKSPVIEHNHILILGFDGKVPLIVRELGRSHQRRSVVVLADDDKTRLEAVLRNAQRVQGSKIRVVCRTGDPRNEHALLRVCADRARTIVVIPPSRLDDDHALRWLVSALLAVRRSAGSEFRGRILVEARRSDHAPLLRLACAAGVAGEAPLSLDVFASDDIIARVLAQSTRQRGIYFALRELLSFRGSELYVEPVPETLVGMTFDDAHAAVENGVAAGYIERTGRYVLCPKRGDPHVLSEEDRLIVLEEDKAVFTSTARLPEPSDPAPPQPIPIDAMRVTVIGANRTLPRLIVELDRLLAHGGSIQVWCPPLGPSDTAALERAVSSTAHASIDRRVESIEALSLLAGMKEQPDAVVILGCEDDEDPDGDASALSILLRFRQESRARGQPLSRLITEVRDPSVAQQIDGSQDDFLVSTDVVAMVLAQAALEPRLVAPYQELLDPKGVEVFLIPRALYVGEGPATFGDAMAAARRRGEVALGFFPHDRGTSRLNARERVELGYSEIDESNPVYLNPPRTESIPMTADAAIVVMADPPDA